MSDRMELRFTMDYPFVLFYDKLVQLVEAAREKGLIVKEADVKVAIDCAPNDRDMLVILSVETAE